MPVPLFPTPYPDVNELVLDLLSRVRGLLGEVFTGMYLDGSLANGGFDEDSDIDFVVVTNQDIAGGLFLDLQAMHDQLAAGSSTWAVQLEGSYISRQAIRRYDPDHALHPNLERGYGERLKMALHVEGWAVHRAILRARGIRLAGPDLSTLIDPVSPQELRRAMRALLQSWSQGLLAHPETVQSRGYQSYIVLSHCRILYTLQTGEVASKQDASAWAGAQAGPSWASLIASAWEGRHHPGGPPDPLEMQATLAFVRFALERLGEIPTPEAE